MFVYPAGFVLVPDGVSKQDVCLAALYVSTKMHDTLKKPRELLAVSYTIRFPELAAKSKNANGEVDLEHMDPAVSDSPLSLHLGGKSGGGSCL
jgi:hypothetical protein